MARMARSKKDSETRKSTPEERMLDLWNQQVFLIRRKYPDAMVKVNAIQKRYAGVKRSNPFFPTQEANEDLRQLYVELGGFQNVPQPPGLNAPL